MEHSKLPWERAKTLIIRDGYPGYIARCLQYDGDYDTACANAAFIVKSCNSHQDLMDLCRNLLTDNVDINSAWDLLDEIERSTL